MDIELTPGKEFERTVARLRKAPTEIKRQLSKEIKDATAPIEKAAKQNVLDIASKGARGGGGAARGEHLAARSKRGKAGATGLRKSISRGVTRKITYSGYRTGVRVRVDGKYMPESQRPLIKATNKGEVRHPVFGNRNNWTNQQFIPKGWFDRATQQHGRVAIRKIQEAARKALQRLGD